MSLPKFRYSPDSSGYSVEDPDEVLSVQLAGGAGRYRRDRIDSSSLVSVSWTFDPTEYRYFRAFYRSVLGRGSTPFLIDLVIDHALLEEYTAYFVPGSVTLGQQRGLAYEVRAQLEVLSNEVDDEAETYFVYLVNEFGEDWQVDEDAINTIVNLDLPDIL